MNTPSPGSAILGREESEKLEFKSRDALRRPESLSRSVVSMLNATGGVIWVGVREENERAVALESVENPEREKRRLEDAFVERIEPPVPPQRVRIDITDVEGVRLLRITVRGGDDPRRPYSSFERRGARAFVTRYGARTRVLTRAELEADFGRVRARESTADASARMLKRRTKAGAEEPRSFWMRIDPESDARLDVRSHEAALRSLLLEPSESGNRSDGWVFAGPYTDPEVRRGCIRTTGSQRVTEIDDTGAIEFRVRLDALAVLRDASSRAFEPCGLVEFPVSVFCLASRVFELTEPSPPEAVVVDYALFGIRGWTLRPGPRDSVRHAIVEPSRFEDGPNLCAATPLRLPGKRTRDEPDRCAYMLLREIYDAFGYPEGAIPYFDRSGPRFTLA